MASHAAYADRVIPRMTFDIGWSDLAAGAWAAATAGGRAARAAAVERALGGDPTCNLAVLSVRSGLHALLQALALPAGSRVAFSAITIKDMPRIAQRHGLQVDTFDLDPTTLAPDIESLRRALTPETKVVIVAHLFGARCDLREVRAIASERGILLIEDCAQAWTGDGWIGHDDSDVVLFSFGPIKTATALGGGVLRFQGRELRDRVAAVQSQWPVQGRATFAKRVGKFCVLSALSTRPVFTAFTWGCDRLGRDWDAMIAQSARGFAGGDFFARISTQPGAPLLALMERRLRQSHAAEIARRERSARELIAQVGGSGGGRAAQHSHWVVPLEFDRPLEAAATLRQHGFDATRGTSSMTVVGDDPQARAPRARAAEDRWLYVPCHRGMTASDLTRLASAVRSIRAG